MTADVGVFCSLDKHDRCPLGAARCGCPCHHQETTTMPETPQTTKATSGFPCPDCDRTFASPAGLGSHRSRTHGIPGARRGRPRRDDSPGEVCAKPINVDGALFECTRPARHRGRCRPPDPTPDPPPRSNAEPPAVPDGIATVRTYGVDLTPDLAELLEVCAFLEDTTPRELAAEVLDRYLTAMGDDADTRTVLDTRRRRRATR